MPRRTAAIDGSETTTAESSGSTARGGAKLQRWVDLLAALLNRNVPATFEDIARDVPQYAAKIREYESEPDERRRATKADSLKRTFERDKQELRVFGIPLLSELDSDGHETGRYRLDRRNYYLPYLSLVAPDGSRTDPKRVDRYGYKTLSTLSLGPDELSAIVSAAAVVRSLGDPLLSSDATSALRKLAVDLPIGAFSQDAEPVLLLPRARPGNAVLETLGDALRRRKTVTFDYHALSTDAVERREVHPYGLFFLNGHWYLVAHDTARGELRNFRLNRISWPALGASRPLTPDYDIPADFRLREHAASRNAWELGDSDVIQAVVEVRDESGPTVAAARLGATLEADPTRRAFVVRRADTFVRWLLSTAGGLVPVAPPEIVARYHEELRLVRDCYEREGDAVNIPSASFVATVAQIDSESTAWQPRGAAAQFQRILQLVPEIADGDEHDMREVAEKIGTDVGTLQRDLYSLVERYDLPGGFVEGVQLFMESGRLSAHSSHLHRPMRLTVNELCALTLGLSVLRGRRSPAEHGDIEAARGKLEQVVAMLPGDELPMQTHAVMSAGESGGLSTVEKMGTLKRALRDHRKVRLVYRKSGATTAEARTVCPYRFFEANGMLYLAAHCGTQAGVQFFRMDRMEAAELTDETFDPPADLDLSDVEQSGRVFRDNGADSMIVRYGKRIARWIAERERCTVNEDGEVVLEHPLADPEWGIRHVLQYGVEAEIVSPPEMRERMRDRLRQMAEER